MFELADPWGLCLLPIPWLIWFFLAPQSSASLTAMHIPFFRALATLILRTKMPLRKQVEFVLACIIWVLLVVAFAGPRWVGKPEPLSREGYNIMLALDLSESMDLSDMRLHGQPATRLDIVKKAALQFVKDRPKDKIGLILFGARAYLQTPLTYDHHNIAMWIEDATAGLAGKTTSIGDALGLAVKRLQYAPSKGRLVILLTDGVNNAGVLAPLKAAELARKEGIKVYTIGLGSDRTSSLMPGGFFDMSLMADLDEKTLKEVAKITHGHYFRATDMSSLQTIYHTINKIERVQAEAVLVQPQYDYYPWVLALALCFSLYGLARMARFSIKTWRFWERF